ncbi:terminase small subunit [Parablautia intestinalis]|uniref:terminase small subunit n=1 Tax=Parablautia intestinalis TaxID=2320100 RepID=UPI00256EC41F|nr:terminase small subunit [Parablautia intestinalis]
MPRKPDGRVQQAKELFQQGLKLIEIAKRLELPEGTVRRWKSTYKWDNERSDKNSERSNRNKHIKKNKEKAVASGISQEAEPPDLTDKQRLFCCLYVKCFNATKAYQKAYGCSYETAMVEGSKTLRNPKIKNEIQRLKQNRLNREMLSEADVFQKYMDIAFADITDYVEFGRETVPVMGAYGPVILKDEETGTKIEMKKEINVIRLKESTEVDGTLISEVKQGKEGTSIKLADRMKALQWISDHMDLATEEQRAKIAVLKSQVVQENEAKGQAKDWKAAIIEIAKRRSKKADGRGSD